MLFQRSRRFGWADILMSSANKSPKSRDVSRDWQSMRTEKIVLRNQNDQIERKRENVGKRRGER